LQAGRKAHVIVTMDMPAFAYRGLLHPHDGQPLPLLDLPGLMIEDPVLIGSVSQLEADHRARWLSTMRDYGQNTTLGSTSAATQALSLKSRIERSAKRWWNAL